MTKDNDLLGNFQLDEQTTPRGQPQLMLLLMLMVSCVTVEKEQVNLKILLLKMIK